MSIQTSPADLLIPDERGALVTKQLLGVDFVQSLFMFLRNTESHEPSNQIFETPLNQIFRIANDWMQIYQSERLSLQIKGEQIFIEDRRIRPKPKSIKKLKLLLKFLKDRGVTSLSLPKDLKREELNVFLWTLAKLKRGSGPTQIADSLRIHGLDSYELKSLSWTDAGSAAESPAENLYHQLFEFTKECLTNPHAAEKMKPVSLDQILYEMNSLSEEDFMNFLCRHSVLPAEHPLTHVAVMSAFTLFGWGRCLGLPPFVLVELAGCGLGHPLTIVHQPEGTDLSSLDRATLLFKNLKAFEKIWPHTSLQVLSLLEFSLPFGENGVYEVGGRKCYSHVFSRMLRIVALFQQMICHDRRRKTQTPAAALERLLTDNLGCDRSLVKLFVNWLGVYPVGSLVKLRTGEVGQVASANQDLQPGFRPQIKILKEKTGADSDRSKPIDLAEINERIGVYQQSIQSTLTIEEAGISLDDYKRLTSSFAWAST